MFTKLFAVAALFASTMPLTVASQAIAVTEDDGGDLNPQPLPPIAEEGIIG